MLQDTPILNTFDPAYLGKSIFEHQALRLKWCSNWAISQIHLNEVFWLKYYIIETEGCDLHPNINCN